MLEKASKCRVIENRAVAASKLVGGWEVEGWERGKGISDRDQDVYCFVCGHGFVCVYMCENT